MNWQKVIMKSSTFDQQFPFWKLFAWKKSINIYEELKI